MQDEKQDILYRAAEVWKELTGYHYRLTYGYKGELHRINLTFSPEDFPHLAGFQYLKDLVLPRYSPRKTVGYDSVGQDHPRNRTERCAVSGTGRAAPDGAGATKGSAGTGLRPVLLYAALLPVCDPNQGRLPDL